MKIGLIIPSASISSTGGVKIQGEMWKKGLEELGQECILIDFWGNHDWESYDAIIVLGYGGFLRSFAKYFRKVCKKFVLAPIIDPSIPKPLFKLLVKHYGMQKIGLSNRFHDLYLSAKSFDTFLARSQFEADYISYCLDVPMEKIKIVPLSVRIPFVDKMPRKKELVLHISRLCAPNKNIKRLIQAAVRYNFQLRLGGILNGEEERQWLYNLITGHDNIQYIGLLSDKELINWYSRCKVFALPSLVEGVGMVALEAAGRGCEIVLTNNGAPKEYYKGFAYLVNPKSVDDIGKACVAALHGDKQPELLQFVRENYNIKTCTQQLINAIS
jgi:glycosyltransferase involved in cell wall biosynthesis